LTLPETVGSATRGSISIRSSAGQYGKAQDDGGGKLGGIDDGALDDGVLDAVALGAGGGVSVALGGVSVALGGVSVALGGVSVALGDADSSTVRRDSPPHALANAQHTAITVAPVVLHQPPQNARSPGCATLKL